MSRSRSPVRLGRAVLVASFLAPALLVLGALVVYPIVYTLIRSTQDASGTRFVGWQNYVTMFTNETTFTAIRNNILWVVVAPVTCTVLGLIFAVLLEKLRWKAAFRLIIFMPMAISMLAAGVIFRGLFQESPQLGAVNAMLVGVHNVFSPEASYPGARAREGAGIVAADGIIASADVLPPGTLQDFPLTAIRQDAVPAVAMQARTAAQPGPDAIAGTVFLDVIPGGGGVNGQISEGKRGLPGVRVDVVDGTGKVAGHAVTADDGTYRGAGLEPGQAYRVALPASNFGSGYQGVSWLSSTFINAVVILAYV